MLRNINHDIVPERMSLDGDEGSKMDFMQGSGIGSSSCESMALQGFFNTPAVAAFELMKHAPN